MILGILIFIATLCIDLYTDLRLYRKGKAVNHYRGAALRLIGLIPAVWLMGIWSAPMLGFWYIVLFNGIYNQFNGRKWEYLGTTAVTDKLQRKYPWLKTVKYAGLVVFTAIYCL